MPFCPKCEDEYRAGIERCADCGVELVETLKRPRGDEPHEQRWAEEAFADEKDRAFFCPCCWTEFLSERGVCSPCGGLPVQTAKREAYETVVGRSQLDPYCATPRPDPDPDLVRLARLPSPAEAGFVAESLAGMGVAIVLGDDAMDRDLPDAEIGLWVRREDLEDARLLLPEPDHDEGQLHARDRDAYRTLVRAAESYADLQRDRRAIALCAEALEVDGSRHEALLTLGRVLGRRGNVAQAVEAYEGVHERLGPRDRTPALFLAAVHGFLTEDGETAFHGARAEKAWPLLTAFRQAQPRRMDAALLALEAAVARGSMHVALEVVERVRKVNAQVLRMPGLPGTLAERAARSF